MKDKRAAKAKLRRRMDRKALLQNKKDELAKKFDDKCIEMGVHAGCDKNRLWREHQRLKHQFESRAIMTALIAALYWLNSEKHWAVKRLADYVSYVKRVADTVDERGLVNRCEDLKLDVGIDLLAMFGRESHKLTQNTEEFVIYTYTPFALTAVLYPLYFENKYAWREKRMTEAAEGIGAVWCDMLENHKTNDVIQQLENSIGIRLSVDSPARIVR